MLVLDIDCFDELKLIYISFFFFRNIDCNLYCFLCYCLNKLFSDKKQVTSRKEFIHKKNSFAPGGGFGFVLSGVTTEFSNQSRSGKFVYHFSIRTFLLKSDESKNSVENQCQYCRLFFTQCSTHLSTFNYKFKFGGMGLAPIRCTRTRGTGSIWVKQRTRTECV